MYIIHTLARITHSRVVKNTRKYYFARSKRCGIVLPGIQDILCNSLVLLHRDTEYTILLHDTYILCVLSLKGISIHMQIYTANENMY
jgi:hypothetical protein